MAVGTPEHSGQVRVVFDRDADLPVADDGESLVKVNDAVGHHVFRPKNLIIHTPKFFMGNVHILKKRLMIYVVTRLHLSLNLFERSIQRIILFLEEATLC
ncbi:hypothetical protein QYF36_001960 [Acer negundo]|nr:hypothetical protein QYF36_001960 [Acer negundo]